ncbi:MAG: tetratricopeptide repeat protein [Cyanobacteria bacterium J06631_2]
MSPSTEMELSAALLGIEQSVLAKFFIKELGGLKVSVSRGLNSHIKDWISEQTINDIKIDSTKDNSIKWSDIPSILKQYKRKDSFLTAQSCQRILDEILPPKKPSKKDLERLVASIPQAFDEDIAGDIINKVNKRLVEIEVGGKEFTVSQADIDKQEELGDTAEKAGDFVKALKCYRKLLEKNPKDRQCIKFIVKIVLILRQMERFNESASLALFALQLVSDKEGRSRLYEVLGSVFGKKALVNFEEEDLRHSIEYRKKSTKRPWGYSVLGRWNSFELLAKFSLRDSKYSEETELMFLSFLELVDYPQSDFDDHRESIVKNAEEIRQSIENKDPWLYERLSAFINKYK